MFTTLTVTEEEKDLRLDAYLARALPGCSLRGAKRLLERGLVLTDGKARPPHYRLRAGNVLTVHHEAPVAPQDLLEAVRLVAVTPEYAALLKPAGLHTAYISGSAGQSLEAALPALWPGLWAALRQDVPPPPPRLLIRLDQPTSGLVLAAFTPDAAEAFRRMETAGKVEKDYAAVVRGRLTSPLLLTKSLDSSGRTKTRVQEEYTPDATRHTLVTPDQSPPVQDAPGFAGQNRAADSVHADIFTTAEDPATSGDGTESVTRVTARIRRGARHQIRAHLANAGFPIVGDTLYGPDTNGPLRLHHTRLSFPGLTVCCPPLW